MSVTEVIRSWKDEDFWMSLSDEQRALLPDNPAGDAGQDLSEGRSDRELCAITIERPHCLETNVIFCTRFPVC
jgi:mersacidin/lichenicidin family type 2 lantibiotic